MIDISDVTAGYNGKVVLNNISLLINESITIILGPNGAGKTTLFRVITGVLPPMKGSVFIDGRDVYRDPAARQMIGYLPHKNGLLKESTVIDNLKFYSKIYGLDGESFSYRLRELNELLELEEILHKKIPELSFGQKKRVALARTLLHNPKILILDEPTEGLDPLASRRVRDYLQSFTKDKLILLSTHNLYEAFEIGSRICLLNKGMLSGCYSKQWIMEHIHGRVARIYIRGSIDSIREFLEERNILVRDNYLEVNVESSDILNDVLSELVRNNIRIISVKERGNPLEELFDMLQSD